MFLEKDCCIMHIFSAEELILLMGASYLKARCLGKVTYVGEASLHPTKRQQMLPLHQHISISIETFRLKIR